MHPNVRQEGPGRCPTCGMRLVEDTAAQAPSEEAPTGWRGYLPLMVVVGLLLATTSVVAWRDAAAGHLAAKAVVATFMTGFFLAFAAFKLLDLRGFAEGYATYDLLARPVYAYGFVYPFVELGFGLAMLGGITQPALLWAEVGVMTFSGIGVVLKLAKGEKFQCACLGTFLKVPLTKVTLVEDFGMAAMALYLLFG
ncbi:MAG: MauE/DoxX family redox-associated membrane protein [bacterium]